MISNILITVPPSPFVNRIPCLHRRGEQSLVETLIEGLGRTVGFESASVRILTHDPPAGPSLGDRLAAELHANYRHLVQGIRALNSFELLAEIAK